MMGVSLYRRGKVYWAKVSVRGETPKRLSLHTRDRAVATQVKRELERRLATGDPLFGTSKLSAPTFAEYADRWLEEKADELSKGTLPAYRSAVETAKVVIGRRTIPDVSRADARAIAANNASMMA